MLYQVKVRSKFDVNFDRTWGSFESI